MVVHTLTAHVISGAMSLDTSPFPVYQTLLWFVQVTCKKFRKGIDRIFLPCINDILSYSSVNFQVTTFNRTKVMIQQVELFEWPS